MKQIEINNIWTSPKYLPYVQPSLTDEIILEAEKKIGYKFPKEYLAILKIQNGGYIRYSLKDTAHSQISGIGQFYNSITDFEWFKEYEEGSDMKLDGLFPFDGDGHWNICLDYRNNKLEPEITLIDTESETEDLIAINFKEYLNILEIETENGYVIETELRIENFIQKVSILLNIEFEEPNTFDHGYKTYRSKYNKSYIWISPNKVPSGFVRESDKRFEELKSVPITEKLRYPEVPENYLFISVSDKKEQKGIFKILQEGEILIKELSTYFEESLNR